MLIGLGCQKQVGKDTVAKILQDKYDFHVTSFAAPLKNLTLLLERKYKGMLAEVEYQHQLSAWACSNSMNRNSDVFRILYRWGLDEKLFEEVENGKLRKLLQWLGTDLIRNQYDEDFWIKAFASTILNKHPRNIWTIVTDVRFLNEKKFIEKFGAAVHVARPNQLGRVEDIHESENSLLNETWEYTIVNDSGFKELDLQCEDLMSVLLQSLEHDVRPTLKDMLEVSVLLHG